MHVCIRKIHITLVKVMNRLIHFHSSTYVKKSTTLRDSVCWKIFQIFHFIFPTLRDSRYGNYIFFNKLKALYEESSCSYTSFLHLAQNFWGFRIARTSHGLQLDLMCISQIPVSFHFVWIYLECFALLILFHNVEVLSSTT